MIDILWTLVPIAATLCSLIWARRSQDKANQASVSGGAFVYLVAAVFSLVAGLIWAIKFTEDWYRLHMPPLKAAFEDDAIRIAPDAEHLSDLRIVKVVRGTPRVPPTREGEKGKRRHGDYAIALALAHFASRVRWVEYAYRAVGRAVADDAHSRMAMRRDQGDTPVRDWWQPPMGARLGGGL